MLQEFTESDSLMNSIKGDLMLMLSNAFWCGGYYFNFDNIAEETAIDDSVSQISTDEPKLPPSDDRKMEVWVDVTPWGEPMADWLKRLEDSDGSNAGTLKATRSRTIETYGGGKGKNPDWLGLSKGLVTFGISRSRTIPTIPLTILFNLEPYMPKPMPQ